MKKWIHNAYFRIILFVIGFVLLHVGVCYIYFNHVAYKANKRYRQDAKFEKEADTLNHLFVGSSRTNKGIAIDSIEKSFKVFGPTESAPYHYYRTKYLLENHPYPIKQIIVPAELGVLSFNAQPLQFMGQYWRKYVNFYELGSHTNYPFYFYGMKAKIELFPYHQRLAALLIMYDMKKEKVIWRYFKEPAWNKYTVFEQHIILSYLLERHFSFGDVAQPVGITYFKKLAQLGEQYGVPIVFLKYPLRSEYFESVERLRPGSKRWETWTDSVVNSSKNCYLLDAKTKYEARPEYFLDPHHLNEKGKAHFTHWLKDTLTRLPGYSGESSSGY